MLDSIIILAATSAEATASGNPISELAGQFHLNAATITAQAINFIIVTFLIWKFAVKPIVVTMDARQKRIQEGLDYADEMEQRIAETKEQQAETLKEARLEAKDIIEEARKSAAAHLEAERQRASREAEQIIKNGNAAVAQERSKMLEEVRGEISGLVVATTAKLLRKDLNDSEKKAYNESAAKALAEAS